MDKPILHLSCDPAALRAALGLVGYAIDARSPMPILHHVLLQAQIGRTTLTATSLDLTVRTNLAADVTVSGVATLPAKLLANIVKAAPEEAVLEIVVTAGRARLTCGDVQFELYTLPPGDFPTPVAPNGEPAVFMPSGALAEMLRQTAFAAGTDEMRPSFTGVSVGVSKAQVRMVATDGARLAMRTASRPQNGGASLETIIPARNALVLSRLCTVPDDEVALR
ncbi:MAG: DNA polymerase III subunit beta, partial [bacterium]|nr:DNA polymerase III subunit beta [bacterium]